MHIKLMSQEQKNKRKTSFSKKYKTNLISKVGQKQSFVQKWSQIQKEVFESKSKDKKEQSRSKKNVSKNQQILKIQKRQEKQKKKQKQTEVKKKIEMQKLIQMQKQQQMHMQRQRQKKQEKKIEIQKQKQVQKQKKIKQQKLKQTQRQKQVNKQKENDFPKKQKQKKIKKERKNKQERFLQKQKNRGETNPQIKETNLNNIIPHPSQTKQDSPSIKQQFISQCENNNKYNNNVTLDQKNGQHSQKQIDAKKISECEQSNYQYNLQIYHQSQQESLQGQLNRVLQTYKNKIELINPNEFSLANDSSCKELKQIEVDEFTPTYREISLILQMFKEKFPHKNIDKIITQLYTSLIEQNKNSIVAKQNVQKVLAEQQIDNASQFSQSIANYEDNMKAISQKGRKGVVKRYIRDPQKSIKFVNEQQKLKHDQKVIVAKSFCDRDYGIQSVYDQINQSKSKIIIDRNRYKTLVSSIAAQSYRRLQKFLIYECKKNIRPLNKEQMRSIYTILQNCRKNFQTQQCSTYIKFIKLSYELASVTITEQAAIKLYIVIQKALKSRIGEMQLDRLNDTMRCNKEFKAKRSFQNQRFQLHKIWSNQLENQFLQLYKKSQQIVKIRDYFKQKYAKNQHLFTIQSLRSRFNKILRVALRKVNCFCEKFGQQRVPNLIKLNDLKVKFILRSPQALNARLLLVDMYLYDECDIKRLYQTVAAVNQFVIMKENQRMNQIIQAQPLINSANNKIQHNVSISKYKSMVNKEDLPDDIYLKGEQKNYQHIVQTEKGQNLHYYRKVGAQNNQKSYRYSSFRQKDLKVEDIMQNYQNSKKSYMQQRKNKNARLEEDSLLSFEKPVQEGGEMYINPNNNKSDQTILQDIIRQEMQKFYYQKLHGFPKY